MSIPSRFRSCLRDPGAKSPRPGPRAKLGLERLDDRIVPSGNVTGTVTLIGDPQDNAIEISNIESNIRITGLAGTTVNYGAQATFHGAYQDVVILRGGGGDVIDVDTSTVVSRDLIFRGGADSRKEPRTE